MVHFEPRAEGARLSLRDGAGIRLDPAQSSASADHRSPGGQAGLGVSS
ncbi:hypothetical protein SA2016_2242 [Sinomonas atrocyanea]|uniref:Uncharacterized protein n=1 Tax=Sinomonas atrocyanea TaxID=37927 RepID=A0A127A209_9MICC|nr:hypothetical protein SA2016_2242 [Sinomonas atrocyanea]